MITAGTNFCALGRYKVAVTYGAGAVTVVAATPRYEQALENRAARAFAGHAATK